MNCSQSPRCRRASIWRNAFILMGVVCAALAILPNLFAGQPKNVDPPVPGGDFYYFVNATNKFTDDQISWSFGDRGNFKPFSQGKSAPAKMGGSGRMYFKIDAPAENGEKAQTYKDFIEFTHAGNGNWFGNTTQVDEFVFPITIEIFEPSGKTQKVGITESRTKLFEQFKKEAPKEFQACVKGNERIVSPCRAGFGKGGPNGNYYDKYIDEVWTMYATKKETPGGWTGEVVNGALTFSKPGQKTYTLPKKPSTQDAFLGQNDLGKSADWCAAVNRHVLADPGDWRKVDTYYKAEPCNFYAKFFHEHSIRALAYGFCYDDFNQQAAYFEGHPAQKLIVTIYWDTPPADAK